MNIPARPFGQLWRPVLLALSFGNLHHCRSNVFFQHCTLLGVYMIGYYGVLLWGDTCTWLQRWTYSISSVVSWTESIFISAVLSWHYPTVNQPGQLSLSSFHSRIRTIPFTFIGYRVLHKDFAYFHVLRTCKISGRWDEKSINRRDNSRYTLTEKRLVPIETSWGQWISEKMCRPRVHNFSCNVICQDDISVLSLAPSTVNKIFPFGSYDTAWQSCSFASINVGVREIRPPATVCPGLCCSRN